MHTQSCLNNSSRFSCHLCNYKATQRGHFKVHIDSVHERIRYPCNFCDQSNDKGKILKSILIQFMKEFAIPSIIVIRATTKGKFMKDIYGEKCFPTPQNQNLKNSSSIKPTFKNVQTPPLQCGASIRKFKISDTRILDL